MRTTTSCCCFTPRVEFVFVGGSLNKRRGRMSTVAVKLSKVQVAKVQSTEFRGVAWSVTRLSSRSVHAQSSMSTSLAIGEGHVLWCEHSISQCSATSAASCAWCSCPPPRQIDTEFCNPPNTPCRVMADKIRIVVNC